MNYLHYHASLVNMDEGGSSVSASAYAARTSLYCERDGQTKDYSRDDLHGQCVVADLGITIPGNAPAWMGESREALWNSVEAFCKRGNCARKIVVALPDDIPEADAVELARQIVAQHVADGHIVDAVVHRNSASGDGNLNRHLHMLEPVNGVGPNGFTRLCETHYLVRNADGEEEWMPPSRLKEENGAGATWEKIFNYRKGGERKQLTPTEAEALGEGWKRTSKHPLKQARYLNEWHTVDDLKRNRARAAQLINDAQGRAGLAQRVDHRSYAEQGLQRIPTVHEGAAVRAVEERAAMEGAIAPVTSVRRHNEEVRRANGLLRQIAGQIARCWAALKLVRESRKAARGKSQQAKARSHVRVGQKARSRSHGSRRQLGGRQC